MVGSLSLAVEQWHDGLQSVAVATMACDGAVAAMACGGGCVIAFRTDGSTLVLSTRAL